MEKVPYAGLFNREVEFFKMEKQNTPTSERASVPVSLGKKRVQRIDVSGQEEEDGKLMSLSVCKFIMRFDRDILINGTKYYIQDLDGKYQVNSINITGPGRNRFLELKCSSRE
jgi:hypothetical protein